MPAEHSTHLKIRNPKLRCHRNHCAFLCACSLSKTHLQYHPSRGPKVPMVKPSSAAAARPAVASGAPQRPRVLRQRRGSAVALRRRRGCSPGRQRCAAEAPPRRRCLGWGFYDFYMGVHQQISCKRNMVKIHETCGFKP